MEFPEYAIYALSQPNQQGDFANLNRARQAVIPEEWEKPDEDSAEWNRQEGRWIKTFQHLSSDEEKEYAECEDQVYVTGANEVTLAGLKAFLHAQEAQTELRRLPSQPGSDSPAASQ